MKYLIKSTEKYKFIFLADIRERLIIELEVVTIAQKEARFESVEVTAVRQL